MTPCWWVADPALFDPATWADAPTAAGYSGGRGATRFIRHDGQEWVLRHYHRGGIMGRVFSDGFLWPGENRTRCFREWHLLHHMTVLGLPCRDRSPPAIVGAESSTRRT